ncbi:hypothetical protein [Burkholderia guangdongensis]|uniref:hypothetical protein n=1 Tax=Burkholderia guangdongensis TaxID=1792500 RepID=UPI0015CB58C2|nr:hypothetical protein [Burkholderia guangdongensis]
MADSVCDLSINEMPGKYDAETVCFVVKLRLYRLGWQSKSRIVFCWKLIFQPENESGLLRAGWRFAGFIDWIRRSCFVFIVLAQCRMHP